MDISVVIPLYNKAPHIQRALDSILSQSYPPKEIVVVDDGSTDGSGEIVKACSDPRIKLLREENSGISTARNLGICETSSDFIALLDADDEWKPEHLQNIAMLIEEYPECGAYATSYIRDAGSAKIWQPKPQKSFPIGWKGILDIDKYLELNMSMYIFNSSSICIRKAIFDKVGMFNVKVGRGQDLEMWLRILLKYDIAFLNEPLTTYYLDTVNRSIVNFKPKFGILVERMEQLLSDNTLPAKTRQILHEYYCHGLLIKSSEALKKGYPDFAMECLRKTSKTKKFKIRWLKWYFLTILPNNLRDFYLNR